MYAKFVQLWLASTIGVVYDKYMSICKSVNGIHNQILQGKRYKKCSVTIVLISPYLSCNHSFWLVNIKKTYYF